MERSFVTHSRVINDLFAQYANTFFAFCELINNSIQANANNIYIFIDQAPPTQLSTTLIKQIRIKDDGIGVAESDFNNKILNIGTDVKRGGKGIGRFAALQIGATATIKTVTYDEVKKYFTKTTLKITEDTFSIYQDLSKIPVDTKDEVLEGKNPTYYEVIISSALKTKDVDVKAKFEKDFDEIDIEKISSRLQKTDIVYS